MPRAKGRITWRAFLALAPMLGSAAAVAGPVPFSIEQVMQAPYPTSLVAAPGGSIAAWVFDTKGVRNIWIGDAHGAVRAHQVTAYTGDDGHDLGDLAWSPDARAITYVRGQTLEDDGPANVASTPEGPTGREVWVVPAAGGAPRKVGMGHSPAFSPDGRMLVFLDKRRIMVADPQGGSGGEAKPLLTDEGGIRSAAFSPDGRRLLFVSQRTGHTLIGVYDIAARTIAWLAPSLDRDTSPVFSPDGSHVAFVRVPADKRSPFVARRSGMPWSVWVADAATGVGRMVWTADPGPGSVFHPTLTSEGLLWAAADRLVFVWEKTGWLLPYSIDAKGGAARPLAAGPGELAYMTLTPDRRRLLFASNAGDIDRLHIWSVDPARGGATPLAAATKDGIEAFPQSAGDSVFALQSGAKRQLAPVVLQDGRWVPLAPQAMPASFPTDRLVTPQSITFRARDGLETHGQLFLPPGGGSGKHPAILFFHGGPPRQMLAGFHYMSAYSWMYGLNEYLAAKGYVVLSVNYRGGIGYGLDYREADGFGAGGGSETNDLLGAVTYLQGRGDVDAGRVGIWGGSYGGLMTALGLARASDSIAVGVDYAGVYDWASMFAQVGLPLDDPADKARAIASSPIATIDRWRSPVLIVHGDDDRNVPIQQSSELIQDLRAHGVPHEVLILPNEVHDLTRYASWMTLFTATDAYLSRYLMPKK